MCVYYVFVFEHIKKIYMYIYEQKTKEPKQKDAFLSLSLSPFFTELLDYITFRRKIHLVSRCAHLFHFLYC